MKKIVINGKFTGDRIQGIVRNAYEIIQAFDDLCTDMDIILVMPPNAQNIPTIRNIKKIIYGKHLGIKWELIDLAHYLRQNKDYICLNLCNVKPFFAQPGITFVLDIMYKVLPENYRTTRNKISRIYHMIQYKYITKTELAIVTISEFSKEEIIKNYSKIKGKIVVVPCAWQHVLYYKENENWHEKYPFLEDKKYYFSLSTLSNHKNGKWIVEVAKRNPNAIFAIAGKYYETQQFEIPTNVHMLGFITDEDACSLIKHCIAFIHPSIYEGFGIPPLEALALGAEVISSNVTALPEVLGNSVHYIDPYEYNVDLNKILSEPVGSREEVLERYSWKKSAEALKKVILDL